MSLTKPQADGVKKAVQFYLNYKPDNKKPFIISGVAGSGKTFSVKYIINELGIPQHKVAFMAYTGKAVDVMNQNGTSAKTIHSTCYNCRTIKDKETGKPVFIKDLKDNLKDMYALFVIDEVSMVTDDIFADLLSLGIPLIGLGDHNQLPPVGHNKCHDYVLNPDVRLEESIRHKDGNYILTLAEEVLQSPYLKVGHYGDNVKIVNNASRSVFKNADQIICNTNKMRSIISRKLRGYRGIDTSETPLPVAGDKLMSKINQWTRSINSEMGWGELYLINGLIGYSVDDFNSNNNTLNFKPYYHKSVAFDEVKTDFIPFVEETDKIDRNIMVENLYEYGLHTFEYAYAITVHSSQGSEFDDVVLFLRDLWGNSAMRKKLLYTGITRAKKNLTVILGN
jgi:exodeoxyribonuclease-5